MTYLLVNTVFLLVTLLVSAIALARRPPSRRNVLSWALALGALLLLTAVFDNAMIAAGLFDYSPDHTLGFTIGRAPIEDFAYPLAAAIGLPALWSLFGGADA